MMVTEVASKRVLCICVGSAVPCQMMERPGNEATIQSSKMKKKKLEPWGSILRAVNYVPDCKMKCDYLHR